jgi:hypothetical protein
MRHLAAYLLLVLGGNATPSVDDITNVVVAAGGAVDDAAVEALLGDLEGKVRGCAFGLEQNGGPVAEFCSTRIFRVIVVDMMMVVVTVIAEPR